jgi:hypothetical protein
MQAVLAFERLRVDIARAGFLGTPSFPTEPSYCGDATDSQIPDAIAEMAAIRIEDVPPGQLSNEMTVNGIAPRRILLAGSYSSADEFEVDHIDPGSPVTVHLVPNSLAMSNIGYPLAQDDATLGQVFQARRAVRIVDTDGGMHFGQILDFTSGPNPTVLLANFPAVQFRADNANFLCGISGNGKGALLSVVNFIRYDIADMSGEATLSGMFGNGPAYESGRRELIREELDTEGDVFPGSRELVAEYAVDLGFSLFVEPTTASNLTRVSGADVLEWAGNPTALPAGRSPHLIRAVHAWLSVRSREADRLSELELTPTAPGPSLMRVSLHPTDVTEGPYARVRTLQSTIPLNNQRKAAWDPNP